jgi:hypothetical protein
MNLFGTEMHKKSARNAHENAHTVKSQSDSIRSALQQKALEIGALIGAQIGTLKGA